MDSTTSDLIVQMKFGSHLYGTNTLSSDIDLKSVAIPSAKDIILQKASQIGSVHLGRESKEEGKKNSPGEVDHECFSLQRYLGLLSEGQTVAVDMLFAPDPTITSDLWRYIQDNKENLLTKKSAAFVGYCRTQANKYGIKGSRVASAKNALERFEKLQAQYGTAAKVGEFFTAEDEVIDDHTRTLRKNATQDRIERYFECCNRMVGFNNTVKEAAFIFRRIYENYGNRAQQAEKNEGIDWKALSHAVRVGREAVELLETHNVTFPLPYAAHILDIKQGKFSYDAVASEIELLLEEVEKASVHSTLREEPNHRFIEDLVIEVYGEKILEMIQ